MKGLINASSLVHPDNEFLRQKQGRLAKRDLKPIAVTPSPLKMPDSQDPQMQKKAAGCVYLTTRGTSGRTGRSYIIRATTPFCPHGFLPPPPPPPKKKKKTPQILHPKWKILQAEKGKFCENFCNDFTQPNFFLCNANTAVQHPQKPIFF